VNPQFSRNDACRPGPISATAGIGLRLPHHQWLIEQRPVVSWLEVHPENYMTEGSASEELDRIAGDYPLSLHAVGLSLGSVGGPDSAHLERLKELVTRYQPHLVSDHLSWSAVDGIHLPDLLPLPYTDESLDVFSAGVDRVQSALKRPILVENPSRYLSLPHSMPEAAFLAEIVRRTGCGVLLDVNNIYVSALNCGADPDSQLRDYLKRIPGRSIGELHVAGHTTLTDEKGRQQRVDDHGSEICGPVWQLLRIAVAALGPRPTLIEWDTRLPAFEVLQGEASVAQWILEESADTEHRCAAAR
jgi:uncharacterized protein (UPF0276 family)